VFLLALALSSACKGNFKNEDEQDLSVEAQQWHTDSLSFAHYTSDTVFQMNEARDLAASWLERDFVRKNPQKRLTLLVNLAKIELTLGHLSQCVSYSREGIELADSLKRPDARHFLDITRGAAYYREGRKATGLPLVSDGTRYFVSRKTPRDIRNASYGYGQLMTILWADNTEQAINAGMQREVMLNRLEKISPKDSDFIDQQRGFLYSKMADMLALVGNQDDAKEYAEKFHQTRFSNTIRGRQAILDYYLSSSDYDAFIAHFNDTKEYWSHKDTICTRYYKLLWMMAQAYEKKGDYKAALLYKKRQENVRLQLAEKESALSDERLSEQENKMAWKLDFVEHRNAQIAKGLKLFVTVFLIALGALLLLTYRNRYQRQENETLHETLDEQASRYRELFARNQKKKPEFTEEMQAKVALFHALFDKEKIFLEPDLSRATLEERLQVDKNTFSLILQHAVGEDSNLSNFIATKRISYACQLMRDFPEYSIKEIAEKSGFYTVRNFRLLFNKQMGVSPQEYKTNLTK